MTENWFDEQFAARRTIARNLGGRLTRLPERLHSEIGWMPSRHFFAVRLPEGLLVWIEVWCNTNAARQAKRDEARVLGQRGFRSAFLPTNFSTRCIGDRQPMLLAPLDSDVDFDQIAQRLVDANFVGVRMPELTATA